jgi:hypothetical protein
MHFGEYGIDPAFARLNTRQKFHDHLVRQHFLPADRTPDRKKKEVEELYQPALFSAPHTLASMPTANPSATEKADFDAVLAALNGRTLSPPLVAKLAAMMAALSVPGWSPTPAAKLTVKKKDAAWVLTDTLAHENIPYSITYKIDTATDGPNTVIRVQAQLSIFERRKFSEGPLVMLQLFLTPDEDGFLRGRLLRFAGYAEGDHTSERKDHFVAALKLLKMNQLAHLSVPGVDLKDTLNEGVENLNLTQPQVTTVTAAANDWPGQDDFRRAEWTLQDGARRWSIRLENPATPTADQAYTLTLYAGASPYELYIRELDYLADHVGNADTPGTELAAYFDRLSIDQLLSVVEFLRSPFKPGHSLYITHAQQAMKRKRGFEQWVFTKYPELVQPYGTPVVFEDEWEMTLPETQDKRDTSYEFDFSATWAEVKNMYPAHIPFQTDLFLEEDFAHFYNLSLAEPTADLQTDSPTLERSAPSAFESQFASQPSATDDKGLFEDEDPTAGCKEFADVIDAAMQVKDLPAGEIEKMLEQHTTSGGTSYFDLALSVAKKYSSLRTMGNFVELTQVKKLPWVPSSQDGLITEPLKRILTHELEAEISWWAASEGVVAANTAMLQAGLGVLWAWSVIMVPLKMLKKIAEDEVDADEKWEAIGYITAVRQWLRRAAALTYHASGFPDLHSIHVDTPVSTETSFYTFSNEPYYIGRYFLEQVEESGSYSPFIWAADPLKRGFDRGVLKMVFTVADELKRRAEHGVDEILDKSGFDSCQIRVLIDAGVLDIGSLQAQAVSAMASKLLERVPRA